MPFIWAKTLLLHNMSHHQKILKLLSDGKWHCGNEITSLFIKDDRKRISELREKGYNIISELCDCGRHTSNIFKRKLIDKGHKTEIKEETIQTSLETIQHQTQIRMF